MRSSYLGIDIGTSGVKVVAVDDGGSVIGSASSSFDFDRPRAGWAETPPRRWWEATVDAIGSLVQSIDISGVKAAGLSGQMHGSVFLGADAIENAGRGEIDALTPALMWNDQRTEAQRAEIERRLGGKRGCVAASGCPSLCGLTAPKIVWLREHHAAVHAKVAGICLPKDFIALALTGVFVTDVGDASGTMLADVGGRGWNAETLARLEIDPGLMPRMTESGAIAGRVTAWASERTGLPEGLPIAIGSGDNQTAAVGGGVVEPGQVLAILGTSGVVLAACDTPSYDLREDAPDERVGRLNLFCDATGTASERGRWNLSGCMLSAAGSLEWARGVLGPDVSFDTLMAEASEVPAGSDGLVFLPYLTGERCPIPDPDARGGWIGLTRSHGRGHLIRSLVEGVCFGLGQIASIVKDLAGEPDCIRVVGGAAKSALWRQVLADATGTPVVSLAVDEGSAFGAAAIAAHADGSLGSLAEISSRWIRLADRVEPRSSEPFERAREAYERLYLDLKPVRAILRSSVGA